MINAQRITIGQRLRSLQLDQVALVVAVTCGLPLFVHAIPVTGGLLAGAVWLPIFYAPLMAVFFCLPHVALTSALLAPTINRLLTGQPDLLTIKMLTTELVIFVCFARIIYARWPKFGGIGVVAYLLASFVSKVLLGAGAFYYGESIGVDLFFSRTALGWPGLLVLFALSILGARRSRGKR